MTNLRTFYTGQEILITGGSGFIGKSLIEKILRCLPNFGKIYVLMRSKNGKTAEERLETILNSAVFERAHKEQPEAFKKISAISGDCQELGLAISAEDLLKLRNVTMIFHSAACVRFDDYLKRSILLNTRGTHELIKIALKLSKLKAFVHVSTAYAYPKLTVLDEKIKPATADWRTSIKLAETYDSETLSIFFPKYSKYELNTYTFTKSLAEQIVNDYCQKLPIMIIRPSIVISSVEEPTPGYIDNFNGPIGLLIACGVGIMRTYNAKPETIADFMPVDICSRGLIIAGYKMASQQAAKKNQWNILPSHVLKNDVEVINCSNSTMSVLSNRQLIDLGKIVAVENPFEKAIWLPEGSITACMYWHWLRYITLQIIPAILLDCIIKLAKQPPILMKLQRRIFTTTRILNNFFNSQYTFYNDNLKNLDTLLTEEEIPTFGVFNYVGYDQKSFFDNGIIGAKKYLLNEPPYATKSTLLRMKIYRVLHYTFQAIGLYYLIKYLVRFLYSYINSKLN